MGTPFLSLLIPTPQWGCPPTTTLISLVNLVSKGVRTRPKRILAVWSPGPQTVCLSLEVQGGVTCEVLSVLLRSVSLDMTLIANIHQSLTMCSCS